MTVANADFAAALQQTRVRLHRAALPTNVSGGVGVSVLLVSVLWKQLPHPLLLAWLGTLLVLLAGRLAIGLLHRRAQITAEQHGTTLDGAAWLRRYRASLLLNGLVWTAAMPLMAPLLGAEQRDPLVYALTALAAGALISTAFDLLAAFGFVAPLVVALFGATLFSSLPDQRVLGGMVLALLAMTLLSALRGQRDTLAGVRLQLAEAQRAEETARLHASASQARQELDDQHRLLTQLLQTTPLGYWFVDNDGTTTDLNPAMCRLLGLPRDAVIGRQVRDFFRGTDLQTLERQIALRSRGGLDPYENGLQRADGSRVDCLVHATPLLDSAGVLQGSVGIWTDITARRHAESDLRSHALVANSITDLVSVVDRNEVYLMVNDAWCQATGLRRDQVLGRRAAEALAVGVSDARQGALRSCIATGQRRMARGAGVSRATAHRMLETTYFPGYAGAAGGPVNHVAMVTRDITDQERTLLQMQSNEAALTTARDEAERANRAKSQFLSQMSHELRTPLNAISGFGQLLQSDDRSALAPQQRTYVREILRGADHLLELINEVLDLGRIETGKLQFMTASVQVLPLLDECLALMRALALSHQVQLHPLPAVPGPTPTVRADRTRLKQVLLNLLGNAIKYNRPGGDVHLLCSSDNGRVRIAVRDSGRGVSAEDQARLFQPFERLAATGSAIQGTGIGLALSRRLVEAMDGEIGAHSEAGVGSTFWLYLPSVPVGGDSAAAGTDTAASPSPATPSPAAPRHTVLYIEDNAVNVVLMEAMLQRLSDVRLITAELPEPGLEMAQRELPALILLDIQLPGMDGFEVLAELRRVPATRHIPVVAVSANALPADINSALAAGFTDYLTKPLQLDRLLGTVQRLLADGAPAAATHSTLTT